MPVPAPYSTVDDLLLGDLRVSGRVDKNWYVAEAGEEIDSKIGQIYTLPLSDDLANHSRLLLKRVNNQLATGRLIMAVDGGSDDSLHAYGLDLVRSALAELESIASGLTLLSGTPRHNGESGTPGPAVVNEDAYSAVAAFEQNVMAGRAAVWQPGT